MQYVGSIIINRMLESRFTKNEVQDESSLNNNVIEIGIDEAGRGSFWGPLMAGAVIIPPESDWTENQKILFSQIRDSKKISSKKREKLYEQLIACNLQTGLGIVTALEINENGISWANQEAFRRAVYKIRDTYGVNVDDALLIIDGILPISNWPGKQKLIIEGDGKYLAIAAASILAKVEHDKWIQEYCKVHTECDTHYDLVQSKGYGTKKHREGISVYGGHELHRTLYIQRWLPSTGEQGVNVDNSHKNNELTTGAKKERKKKGTNKSETEQCLIRFS